VTIDQPFSKHSVVALLHHFQDLRALYKSVRASEILKYEKHKFSFLNVCLDEYLRFVQNLVLALMSLKEDRTV
jgi:hypothetical protein